MWGRYQIQGGPLLEVYAEGAGLKVRVGENVSDLLPESETRCYVTMVNARLFFERDAAGKVTGFTGYGGGDFEGKRVD